MGKRFTNIFRDNEPLSNYTQVFDEDDEVLVPAEIGNKREINNGDRVSVVYNEPETEYREVVFLSSEHPNVYKNLSTETEFSFHKTSEDNEKNFEVILRAISRWDRTFVVDEYYVCGIKDSRFYIAKVLYHRESENTDDSFAYKQVFDLTKEGDATDKFFHELSEEQQSALFLTDKNLNYEDKYKLKCTIVDDTITVQIKNTSRIESLETSIPWVTIIDSVNLNTTIDNISSRGADLNTFVSALQNFTNLNGKGMFGFTVPKSHVKVYRYEVIPLDDDIDVAVFNDEEYSRNVTTEFSQVFKNNEPLKLNSADPRRELKTNEHEVYDVQGNEFEIDEPLQLEDVEKVVINNLNQSVDTDYRDKFVDIIKGMSPDHEGSAMYALVDKEENDFYGQNDEYFEIDSLTDGIKYEYDIPQEFIDKLAYFPFSEIGDVLLEVDPDIVVNDFFQVGIKKNPDKFIDKDKLEELYADKQFYMKTSFRGEDRFVQMGALGKGRFLFNLDEYYTNASDSYKAIWDYNLANFVDDFVADNATLITNLSGGPEVPEGFEFYLTSTISISGYSNYSLGYILADTSLEDILTIQDNEGEMDIEFDSSDRFLDTITASLLKGGLPEGHIKTIISYFRSLGSTEISTVLLTAKKQDLEFDTQLEAFREQYPSALEYTEFQNFRRVWITDLDHNSHITTDSIQKRKFYISLDPEEYSINRTDQTITFDPTPKAYRSIAMRVLYENVTRLATNYKTEDQFYEVEQNIKDMYLNNRDTGVVKLLEYYKKERYNVVQHDNVSYVVFPKALNENNSQLYADVEVCSSYVDNLNNVTRKFRLPLKKVSDILKNDFENSKFGEVYPHTSSATGDEWNREDDFFAFGNEFATGDWADTTTGLVGGSTYTTDYPRAYPVVPREAEQFYSDGVPNVTNFNVFENLDDELLDESVIDMYLDMDRWFNPHNSKLGPYYQEVLQDIINIKSLNRRYTTRQEVYDNSDPFNITNWFDGFYSGTITTWDDTWATTAPAMSGDPEIVISGGINNDNIFGRYTGTPWGTENSRKQMIDQLRNSVDDKFDNYDIYFVDMTSVIYYQEYTLKGDDSSFWNPTLFTHDFSNDELIKNPYVTKNTTLYEFDATVTDEAGALIFSPNDFSTSIPTQSEFPEETLESYGVVPNVTTSILNVIREVNNSVDMFWKFNSSIIFNRALPEGTHVNAEFQYSLKDEQTHKNFPDSIVQQANLGSSDGVANEKFDNPEIFYQSNVDNVVVNRLWLDNYRVYEFDVLQLSDDLARVEMEIAHGSDAEKDVSIEYKISNYFNLKAKNIALDDFKKTRDFSWIKMTREKNGFLKKINTFEGYTTSSTKIKGENVFHLSDDYSETDEITTASTNQSRNLITPVNQLGEFRDIITVIDRRRSNNFEVSVDVYYEDEIPRSNMKTDIIFRGDFVSIDGKQYMNNYYTLTMNLKDNNVALLSRRVNEEGFYESQNLAGVRDSQSVINRQKWYTAKIKLIKDELQVFFNERGQEEKFYFSYHLKNGHSTSGTEAVVESILGDLSVEYDDPKFYLDGDRIGLRVSDSRINFSNFKLTTWEENNLTLGKPMDVQSYDGLVSFLKTSFNITGDFEKFERTTDGYDYIQIGQHLFNRQTDGEWVKHFMTVINFEVVGANCYVHERVRENGSFNIVNVYQKNLNLVDTIVVDGKQFLNEPLPSYLLDTSKAVREIKEINGKLFIVTWDACFFGPTWDEFGECVWDTVRSAWILYGDIN